MNPVDDMFTLLQMDLSVAAAISQKQLRAERTQ
jgi:hypothetical protein